MQHFKYCKTIYLYTMKNNVISVKTLLAKVKRSVQLVSNNPVVPILENIYFTNGKIISSDLTNHLVLDNPGFEGEFLAPAKQLLKVLNILDKNAEIEVTNDPGTYKTTLKVVGSNKTFSLAGENMEDFPKLPECKTINGNITKIDIESIVKALPYASKDEYRPAMCAVYMNGEIVSTDAHRMMFTKTDGKIETPLLIRTDCAKLLTDFKEAEILTSKEHVCFVSPDQTLFSRIVDERFPDYKQAIPENNPIKACISTKELKETLKLSLLAANQTTHQIVFQLSENSLNVSAQDLDYSHDFNDKLDAQTKGFTGCFCIGVNGKLLLEYLNQTDKDLICFEMSAKNRAIILNSEFLIMPVILETECYHNFELVKELVTI